MSLTKLMAGAIVLTALCMIAFLSILATSPRRIFTPDGALIYVPVYITTQGRDQNFVYRFSQVDVLTEVKQVPGVDTALIFGNQYVMRIRLNPDQLQALKLSPKDIKKEIYGYHVTTPSERLFPKTGPPNEYEFTHVTHIKNPDRYENILLGARSDGEIVRLKDVGRVQLDYSIPMTSLDIDGHPAAVLVLKAAPGSSTAEVIQAIQDRLNQIKVQSFWPGMEFQVIPRDSPDMVHAVIQTPRGAPFESTATRCQELAALAKGIDGVTSVASLAGYQIRKEERDENAGTCLIHLKDRSMRKLTSRQIIEKLEEKCRTMNAHVELFEPPGFSVFVAPGGFTVRILDKTNANMDALLKRKNLEPLFQFFANNYPQYELIINNDVATQKGVSIPDALERRFQVIAGEVRAEPKAQRLAKDFPPSSFKTDRGEMVPYKSFLQLKLKPALDKFNR